MGSFPLFPWLAYALSGCVVGAVWMRAAEQKRLGKVMLGSAIVGGLMALAGQLVVVFGFYIFYPTPAVPIPAYPNSYVYRTGMCLVFGALSYWYCLKVPPGRFSPLRILGQTSMFVYIVHIELVYGFAPPVADSYDATRRGADGADGGAGPLPARVGQAAQGPAQSRRGCRVLVVVVLVVCPALVPVFVAPSTEPTG